MKTNYETPPGTRIYAIGDIHGYLDRLLALEQGIDKDRRDFEGAVHIVYIGDYIDRGPDSAGVLAHLAKQRKRKGDGVQRHFIDGNHEKGMRDYLSAKTVADQTPWLQWGGVQAMQSYGIRIEEGAVYAPSELEGFQKAMNKAVPKSHRAFLKNLEAFVMIGGYFFTHAGVDPYRPLEAQKKKDLRAIREPFLSWHKHADYFPLDKCVVHGHTISKKPKVLAHRIGIDTGIYQGGKLTAAVLEGRNVRFLQA